MAKISVVTSVYNGESYLRECVDSILNQTFQDFEYIILNNGSTDRTADILEGYSDPRIYIVHQENLGIVQSLNKGVNLSNSGLIARLDADDYSLPHRLEKQIAYMEQHPETILCGTRYKELVGKKTFSQMVQFVEKDEDIRKYLSYFNPLSHSTIMFRKKAFLNSGGYNQNFKYGHDYDLWVRMLKVGKVWNLNEELNVVRLSDQSTSYNNLRQQKLEGLYIRWNAFQSFGGTPSKFLYHLTKSLLGLLIPSNKHLDR